MELIGGTAAERIAPSLGVKGQAVLRYTTCKVALWSHYGGVGDEADFIRVGTLDDPDACPPDVHAFTESRQPWVILPEDANSIRSSIGARMSSGSMARCRRSAPGRPARALSAWLRRRHWPF